MSLKPASYKLWAVVSLISVLILGALFTWSWVVRADNIFRQEMVREGNQIIQSLSTSHFQDLSFTSSDLYNPVYKRLQRQMVAGVEILQQCCSWNLRFNYFSLYSIVRKNGSYIFGPESIPPDDPQASPVGTIYHEPPDALTGVYRTMKPVIHGPYRNEYGEFISVFIPSPNPTLETVTVVFGVDVMANEYRRMLRRSAIFPLSLTLLFIILILSSLYAFHWRDSNRESHHWAMKNIHTVVTIIFGIFVTVAASYTLNRLSQYSIRESFFIRLADEIHTRIRFEVRQLFNQNLEGLGRLFEASEDVTSTEFNAYTDKLTRSPALDSWIWVPFVPAKNLTGFHATHLDQDGNKIEIWQIDTTGNPIPVHPREYYFPITYQCSPDGSAEFLGFDLGSVPEIREVLEKALATRLRQVTEPNAFLQEESNLIYTFRPVFSTDSDHSISGFVGAAIDMQAFLDDVQLRSIPDSSTIINADVFRLHRTGNYSQIGFKLIASNHDPVQPDPPTVTHLRANEGFQLIRPLFINGKSFAIRTSVNSGDWNAFRSHSWWVTLIIGLTATALVGILVRLIATRRDYLEQMVTERTAALVESTKQYRLIWESTIDGMRLTDADGIILDVNAAYCEMVHKDRDDLVGKPLSIVYQGDHERINEKHRERFKSGSIPAHAENQVVLHDGTKRWLETSNTTLENEEKQPEAVLCVFRDMTTRKNAELDLADSENRFRLIFENNHAVMLIIDPQNGEIIEANPAAMSFYGYDRHELIGMEVSEINTLSKEEIQAEMDRAQKKERKYFEFKHRLSNDEIRDVEIYSGPILYKGGNYLYSLIFDVTDRKAAQLELKETATALREAKQRFQSLYENTTIGLYRTTPDGEIIMANPALIEMLGYEDFHDLSQHNLNDPEFRVKFARSEFVQEIEKNGVVTGRETMWPRKDGSKLCIRESARLFKDDQGRVLYYDGSIEDITDKRQLEQQLRHSQKMEGIGSLAGGIAHDFNNMLTIINGYSELMLMETRAGDQNYQRIKDIYDTGVSAAALTRQLLAFSRKQAIELKVTDLNSIIEQMKKLLERAIGEDIELEFLPGEHLHAVKVDRSQTEQVLMNLAINARDAMPTGGKLTIESRNIFLDNQYCKQHFNVNPGEYVQVAISDSGSGMDQVTQERIFEPFFTTKERGQGTGLGLSTVFGIVRQSGGHIQVYSEVGQGTVFKIYLPVVYAEPETEQSTTGDNLVTGTETILVVDDSEKVRQIAEYILAGSGYHVILADSGSAALATLRQSRTKIDLLLTDVVMPGMSGRELADMAIEYAPELKVLYMSGYTDNAIVHHGILEEGIYFTSKPLYPRKLSEKVREVLDS